jgi:hypothetical protein
MACYICDLYIPEDYKQHIYSSVSHVEEVISSWQTDVADMEVRQQWATISSLDVINNDMIVFLHSLILSNPGYKFKSMNPILIRYLPHAITIVPEFPYSVAARVAIYQAYGIEIPESLISSMFTDIEVKYLYP